MAWDVDSFKTILLAKQGAAQDATIQDDANEDMAEAIIEFLENNLQIAPGTFTAGGDPVVGLGAVN